MTSGMRRVYSEFGRFFSTVALGLILDLTIATMLISYAGFSDYLAATCGLVAGMVFNYALHLNWTFKSHGRKASVGHFLQFSIASGISLLTRFATLAAIAALGWQVVLPPFMRLGISAGMSFVLSYLLCRYVIFRPDAGSRTMDHKAGD